MDYSYFHYIPKELIEILVSYLDYDSLEKFINSYEFLINLNYSLVYHHHFYRHKRMISNRIVSYSEYQQYLGLEDIRNKFHLQKYTIDDLRQLRVLHLDNRKLTELPESIISLTEFQELHLSDNN